MPHHSPLSHDLLSAFFRLSKLHMLRSTEGLRPPEVHTLRLLKQNESTEGLKVSELSQRLHVTPSMVTQVVRSLEGRGLVSRTIDTEDRRAVRIAITSEGMQSLEQTLAHIVTSFDRLATHLGQEKSTQLINLLTEVYDFVIAKKDAVAPEAMPEKNCPYTCHKTRQVDAPDREDDARK